MVHLIYVAIEKKSDKKNKNRTEKLCMATVLINAYVRGKAVEPFFSQKCVTSE